MAETPRLRSRSPSRHRSLRSCLDDCLKDGYGTKPALPLILQNAKVALSALTLRELVDSLAPFADQEGNVLVNITVSEARISKITAAVSTPDPKSDSPGATLIDLKQKLVFPCFCEPHAHLMKVHSCPRCPNPTGSTNDALASEATDRPWSQEDLERRMDFAIRCGYVHGLRVIRTHLDGSEDERIEQREAAWNAFDNMRCKWASKVRLQGVANLFLPLWSNVPKLAERQVAEAKKRQPDVVLGAYCGVVKTDEARKHFQKLFELAYENSMPVDLHIDETNDPDSMGMLVAMQALIEVRKKGFDMPVVCGHCCAVSLMPRSRSEEVIRLAHAAGNVTVVANPLTNAWLQDRRGTSAEAGVAIPTDIPRTPQWRGMTLVQEFESAGVAVALGGDNVRDFWFNYGDTDPVEVFRVGVLLGHLDKPHGSIAKWAMATSRVPAAAFGENFFTAKNVCSTYVKRVRSVDTDFSLGIDSGADFVIFHARSFSELMARPQSDRIVMRSSNLDSAESAAALYVVDSSLPEYAELDDLVQLGKTAAPS